MHSSLYTNEMETHSETIDILCSDEASRTFGDAIKPDFKTRLDTVSFLQTSEPSRRALDTLRKAARSAHSL